MAHRGPLLFRSALLEEIVDLRHAILRSGLPRQTALFDGDEHPTTRHFAAVRDGKVVGCLTLHLNSWENQPAWQLRGMAVDADLQNQGMGRELLNYAEEPLSEDDRPWWCNARVAAVGFYQKMGWEIVSPPFEIPTAGPHVKMMKR